MNEHQRKKIFGRIFPTVFVRAVFDLRNYRDFVVGQALRAAFLELELIKVDEKSAARFRPKGESCKRLASNTAKDMRDFDDSGRGEDDYRIITEELFRTLSRYPILYGSALRFGSVIRGVLLEPHEHFGLTKETIDDYLNKNVAPYKYGETIMDMRDRYQQLEAERKQAREGWRKRQAEHRARVKADFANATKAIIRANAEAASNADENEREKKTAAGAGGVDGVEVTRVLAALTKRHPKKAGNERKLNRAVKEALQKIDGDELIAAHDRWVAQKELDNMEKRYYPKLEAWLNDCEWKNAQGEKPVFISAGCGECGVEIV